MNPFVLNQSANQAMWQLQLKGLEMRFSEVSEANSSKAPGVTQLISFPNKLKLFRLFRPCNIVSLQLISKLELKSCSLRLFLKTKCEKLP